MNTADKIENVRKLQSVIDNVQPYIESHGGVIDFLSFEKGIVRLTLHGSCESCALASVTLGAGIEQMMKSAVPEVEKVVAMDPEGKEIPLDPLDDWREFQ